MEIDDTMVREFLAARGRTAGDVVMHVSTPDARHERPRDAVLVRLIDNDAEVWRGVMTLAEFGQIVAESV